MCSLKGRRDIKGHLELAPDKIHSCTKWLRVAQGVRRGIGGTSSPAALALLIPHGRKRLHHALVWPHILQLVPYQLRRYSSRFDCKHD